MLDLIARFEARSETDATSRRHAERGLIDLISQLRADLAGRDVELLRSFAQLADVCTNVTQRLEADRVERRELTQAVGGLVRCLARLESNNTMTAPPAPPAARVIGGSVFAAEDVVDLAAAEGAEPAAKETEPPIVEVRCRFGDRWVDGFEVCDVVRENGDVRYRLRRRNDGSVLPRLFAADELRTTGPVDPTSPLPTVWSELSP